MKTLKLDISHSFGLLLKFRGLWFTSSSRNQRGIKTERTQGVSEVFGRDMQLGLSWLCFAAEPNIDNCECKPQRINIQAAIVNVSCSLEYQPRVASKPGIHVISDMGMIRSTLDLRDETRAWGRNMKAPYRNMSRRQKIRATEGIIPRRISKDRNATQIRRK